MHKEQTDERKGDGSTAIGRDELAERLRHRIVSGIHLQTLTAGDRLPSVRALVSEFGVDPRVVRSAYERLRADGLVELRPRSGVYVAISSPPAFGVLAEMAEWLVRVLVDARGWGIPPADVAERIRQCFETLRLRAACIECNEDQIDWLAHESRRDYGLEAIAVDLEALGTAETRARLRAADVLLTTAFHGGAHENVIQAAAADAGSSKPLILVTLDREFSDQITGAIERGTLAFVVSDARFADKLHQIYDDVPKAAENLRPVVAGENVEIPDADDVYITHAARLKFPELAVRATMPQPQRVFSSATATELLRFIIRRNMAALRAGASAAGTLPV